MGFVRHRHHGRRRRRPFGAVVVTLRRIDAVSDVEGELRQRLISEGRLVRLASAFVTLPAEQLDEGVDAALEEMGGMSGVDRVEMCSSTPRPTR